MNTYRLIAFSIVITFILGSFVASLWAQEPKPDEINFNQNAYFLQELSKSNEIGLDPFLQLPFYGNHAINSKFDHEFPDYRQLPNGVDIFTNSSGQRWRNPPDPVSSTDCTLSVNCYDGHDGIDYALNYGQVLAAASGEVSEVGWDIQGCYYTSDIRCNFGLHIWLTHNNNYKTLYGHLSAVVVKVNDSVEGCNVRLSPTLLWVDWCENYLCYCQN